MKNILYILFTLIIFSCKNNNQDEYIFPTKLKSLSENDITFLTSNKFYVGINSKFEDINHKDTITFDKSGVIFRNDKQIGRWEKSRLLKIDSKKPNSFISWIHNNGLTINRDTYINGVDSILKWEFLKLNLKYSSKIIEHEETDF